ncbi:MAG: TonB-dependent receptor plug domain-containing protein [Dysgonamonadaceae bacterium]|jgi:TonB-dependent SusC/RagA subfamily outer membrane receptor|nr:TonB-dependent receptor plug domain-containing protein [Dysgonamonadaceae bacterium]
MKANVRLLSVALGLLLSIGGLSAQTIKGKVVDKNGEPISGAVISYGSNNGSTSDANGEFTVDRKDASDKFTVILLGFKQKDVKLNGKSKNLIITLEEDTKDLDQVVVVGYGKSSKRKATGTVSTITRDVLEQYPGTSVLDVLQGRIAGLTLTRTSGLPGSSVSINIRGVTTIDEGFADSCGSGGCCGVTEGTKVEPLIVIDGVPFINESISPLDIGAVGAVGPLASLSTADIERIDVLKDSDATAIYGSRGANGVILITTRHSLD